MKKVLVLLFVVYFSFSQEFDIKSYDRILKTYVNDAGFVDYKGIKEKEAKKIKKLVKQVAKKSPKSHPKEFPTEKAKLVYWFNTYNLLILKTIVEAYPVESIKDIYSPGWRVWKVGHKVGGEDLSFDNIEHDIIRKEFKEPRIHFAINCASYGCPILQNKAFTVENIEGLLEKGTEDFFRSERNFRVDKNDETVYLSSLLDWFAEDFYDEDKDETIFDFVIRYAPKGIAEEARMIKKNDYDIEYIEYDWKLNKQK